MGHPRRAPLAVALGGAGGLCWEPSIWKPSGAGGGVAGGPGKGGQPSPGHTQAHPSGAVALGPPAPLPPASRQCPSAHSLAPPLAAFSLTPLATAVTLPTACRSSVSLRPGQHSTDPGDAAGPGAADPAGDRQQQRAAAHAEHQRGLPVPQDPHPPHGRREAQQGSHSAADGRVHLLAGAGEDQALAAEHTAQALHPGAERLVPEAAGGRRTRTRASVSPDIWEDEKAEDLRREMIEFRQQLDKERSVRMMLEEQVRSLEAHMYPEKLKVIAQQVQLQQQQEQVRLLHQEKLEREQQHLRTQLLPPPAPTHHPTVIVPAPPPPPSHHINVVTMGPSSVINSVSTSRQNLDTIVQAIQHIEGTQDKLEQEEEQRRAVIVKPVRSCPEVHTSDTASDSEASDSDAMDQSREEPLGGGELP
uniref:Transcription factor AP-4 n=1 Tax=Oryctolagus cuniculus TaxID=9986 RepID=G1TW97_RABIT